MVAIRPVQASDLSAISALDARLTGTAKPDYWRDMLAPDRHFLVAETDKGALAGFIAGEIRAWEFGQPAAGWVFAIQIDPKLRLKGVGTALFDALVARFKAEGVTRVRTLVDLKDHLTGSCAHGRRAACECPVGPHGEARAPRQPVVPRSVRVAAATRPPNQSRASSSTA